MAATKTDHHRFRHLRSPALAALVVLLAGAACGSDDTGAATGSGGASRVVEVEMVDIAFEPATLTVAAGEEVTFRFTNTGVVPHDAFVGDEDAQADHEQEVGDDAGMHHGDEEEDAVTVAPGKTGTLTHTFDETGTTVIGCHQPGHYEDGMSVDVTVT